MSLHYIGPLNNCSGYARVRHLLVELYKLGLNVTIKPFYSVDNVAYADQQIIDVLLKSKPSDQHITLTAGIPLQFIPNNKAKINIGYTMFENETLPKPWVDCANRMDQIWVPSSYTNKAFSNSEINKPITTIPYGYDASIFHPKPKKSNTFTFLCVATYIDRKGIDILLDSFIKEFSTEPVELILKLDGSNPHAVGEIKALITRYDKQKSPIKIFNAKVSDYQMAKFYNLADCFVLPSRGEAFGLPFLESLASGVPTIAPEIGGHRDFVNEENSWIIRTLDYRMTTNRLAKINPYYKNLKFPEPDCTHLRSLLRQSFEDTNQYHSKKNATQKHLGKYNYSSIAKEVYELIQTME